MYTHRRLCMNSGWLTGWAAYAHGWRGSHQRKNGQTSPAGHSELVRRRAFLISNYSLSKRASHRCAHPPGPTVGAQHPCRSEKNNPFSWKLVFVSSLVRQASGGARLPYRAGILLFPSAHPRRGAFRKCVHISSSTFSSGRARVFFYGA